MTTMVVAKRVGLVRIKSAVRDLQRRQERARQSFNEKLARAEAEYVDACKRALAAVEEEAAGEEAPTSVEELEGVHS